MKALFLALVLALAGVSAGRAEVVCTLMVDAGSGAVRLQEGGGCEVPAAPASTFKVPLAVMGFDAGVLASRTEPAWPYKEEYRAERPRWRVTITPESWVHESVLWYSRELVQRLGASKFARYVAAFDYGNADVSGDPRRNNGLTHSWLNSSLKITPAGQVQFFRRMLAGELPVTVEAHRLTMDVMPKFLAGRWMVWGKTGTYYERHGDGSTNTNRQYGWFVGWAEQGKERLVFAYLIHDTKKIGTPAGPRARDALLARFSKLG